VVSSEFESWFDDVVRDTHYWMRVTIAGMGVPSEDVDDVTQEVYLDLSRQRHRIPEGVEIRRWLHGMARNCSYEYFRRHSRQHKRLVAMAQLLEVSQPDELPNVPASIDALTACMEQLRPEQRELLEAHYRHGRPIAELALEQQRMATAMHMVFARLREVLRRCIQRVAIGNP
jgi:RNA polymerase sigma factor (sigma-70 family)